MRNYNRNYRTQVNSGIRLIINFYKAPAVKLVNTLMKKHNYSLQDIGDIIGMSREAVRKGWVELPDEEELNGR